MNEHDCATETGSLHIPYGCAAQANEDTVPWVLNQVLLPLILILTFVALVKVIDYRREWVGIVESLRHAEPDLEREVVTMNLQLAKLLAALHVVEQEVTADFRLHLFEFNADRVQRRGATLSDNEFQTLCNKANRVFDSGGYDAAGVAIYLRCLEIAEISADSSGKLVVRTSPVEPLELSRPTLADLDNEDFADVMRADASEISARNRRILHNAILDFLDGLKSRVTTVQQNLISLMAQDLTHDPASFQLPPEADALLRQMTLENDADSIRRLETEFYGAVVDAWRDRFHADGYAFVVWDELKVL